MLSFLRKLQLLQDIRIYFEQRVSRYLRALLLPQQRFYFLFTEPGNQRYLCNILT